MCSLLFKKSDYKLNNLSLKIVIYLSVTLEVLYSHFRRLHTLFTDQGYELNLSLWDLDTKTRRKFEPFHEEKTKLSPH